MPAQGERLVPEVLADRVELRRQLLRGEVDRARADAREPGRVVARRDRPGARRCVHRRQDLDVLGVDAEGVGDDLRADGLVPLALRRRRHPDRDPAERGDADRRAFRVPRLGQRRGALVRRLRERDVAHVRDRGLDGAGDADAEQPPVGPGGALLLAPLVVADKLERVVEAALVVARVVEAARRRAVREVVRAEQVPSRDLDRVEPQAAGGDRHRPLEGEVELGAAEAAVQPGRAAVRQRDAVARGDVTDPVGAGQRAVHPVQRRRLGRADVAAHVLDDVVPQREQLPVRGERGLQVGDPGGRGRAAGQVLEPVLRPAHGHAELARGEAHQDDVDVHGRLDPEAAAGVGRGDQPQLRALEAERGSRDRMQRERPLEVRPGREDAARLVPVGDDAVALERAARPARKREPLGDDEVGARRKPRPGRRRRRSARGRSRPARGRARDRAARSRPRSARRRPPPHTGRGRRRRPAARRRNGRPRSRRRSRAARSRRRPGTGSTSPRRPRPSERRRRRDARGLARGRAGRSARAGVASGGSRRARRCAPGRCRP